MAQQLAFAHNGGIRKPNDVNLGRYRSMLEGDNDSEVVFWLLIRTLAEKKRVDEALLSSERIIRRATEKGKRPFSMLNIIFSDGQMLYAYCRYLSRQKPSLCLKSQGINTMCYRANKDNIVVMSEPSNEEEDWQPLDDRQLLSAKIADGQVEFSIKTL
jgi:predicted glutamine amidotransferase